MGPPAVRSVLKNEAPMSTDLNLIAEDPPIVRIVFTGRLERTDYSELGPTVETLIRKHGGIRVLLILEDFHGWADSGAQEDATFDFAHLHEVERIAIVGGESHEQEMAVFCKQFASATIRFFDSEELAEKWLRTPRPADEGTPKA